MVIGIVLLIGTAGASDVGNIELIQIAKQTLISLAFIVLSLALGKLNSAIALRKYERVKSIAYYGSVK